MKTVIGCLVGLLSVLCAGAEPLLEGRVRRASGEPAAAEVMLFDMSDLRRGPVARAATDGTGYFALRLAVRQGGARPEGFSLGPNYPNPFNPATVIPYHLAASAHVRLEVFNLLGQRVATLVDGPRPAGSHTAMWNATDAAGQAVGAGVYLYRLTVDGAHQTGRMVLIDGQAGAPAGAGSPAAPPAWDDTRVYGLVVSGPGLVPYVNPAFRARVGMAPLDLRVETLDAAPRMKTAAVGILGDVDNNSQIDFVDALLVALYSVKASISPPNNGDVNADGQVNLADAFLIAAFLNDSSDPSLPTGIGAPVQPAADGFAVGAPKATEIERFRDCAECPLMVKVPPGSFTMGSPSSEPLRFDPEGPQHEVTIGYSFAVGAYEVTFAEWDACVDAGGCGDTLVGGSPSYRPDDLGWGRGNRPVIFVDWNDAQRYLAWLSSHTGEQYRLLSEAEWEYVARAGTTGPFHYGETISTNQANYNGKHVYGSGSSGVFRGQTVPVGSFPPNGFGLHDVHGNVWEWTQDCYHPSYEGAPSDGSVWDTGSCRRGRVLRGGSYQAHPAILRSAMRSSASDNTRRDFVGFRVARNLIPGAGFPGHGLTVQPPLVSDSVPAPGGSFTLRATVRNRGSRPVGSTTLRFYRSTDATISSSDLEVGTVAVGPLSGAEISPISIDLKAPANEGIYYYGACVEAVFEESATDNNCSTAVRVTVIGSEDSFAHRWNAVQPEPWWRESAPYSCAPTQKTTSPWTEAGLQDLGGSDPLSLIRFYGNGSYLRYGNQDLEGCTPMDKYPDRTHLDPPADPTYYSLGDLNIWIDIARIPPDVRVWDHDDGQRVAMSMAEAVNLMNTHIAPYFQRVSEDRFRITFRAGYEIDLNERGGQAVGAAWFGLARTYLWMEVGFCQTCPWRGYPGGLSRILFSDVTTDTGGYGSNAFSDLGLILLQNADMETIIHEMGHGWMRWPHSFTELPWQPYFGDKLQSPDPYSNRLDLMSSLTPEWPGATVGWHRDMLPPLAINRYSAGWIDSNEVALHVAESGTYRLSKPLEDGDQFLVIHSGRQYAFTTLEVLPERPAAYVSGQAEVYDPSAPGGQRPFRYDGVLVSRYDQTRGTGIQARFGPALHDTRNPEVNSDVGWGRDDYSVIGDGESRAIGGGVTVSVSRNADGSYDVSVSGGKTAAFDPWCFPIWFAEPPEYDTGCQLDGAF